MNAIDISIPDQKQLVAKLKNLAGPDLRRIAKRTVATAMAPITGEAKRRAPVQGGRLRASIGRLASVNRKKNAFTARVGTRRDFTYKSTAGARLVSGSGKKRDAALSKGFAQDTATAQQYARGIEFGVSKSGKIRRRRGAAHFLEGAITANKSRILTTVASELRRHLSQS